MPRKYIRQKRDHMETGLTGIVNATPAAWDLMLAPTYLRLYTGT